MSDLGKKEIMAAKDDVIEGEFDVIAEDEVSSDDDVLEAKFFKDEEDKSQENEENPKFCKTQAPHVGEEILEENEPYKYQAPPTSDKKENLTAEEQKFLHDRIMGRENAVNGNGEIIKLTNGMVLMDTVIEIGNELREFVGYEVKSDEVHLDEETATAIVLTAKEKGWDSIDVHGSDKEKELFTKIAQEHGLEVTNYQLPEVKKLTQDSKFLLEEKNPEEKNNTETVSDALASPKTNTSKFSEDKKGITAPPKRPSLPPPPKL